MLILKPHHYTQLSKEALKSQRNLVINDEEKANETYAPKDEDHLLTPFSVDKRRKQKTLKPWTPHHHQGNFQYHL